MRVLVADDDEGVLLALELLLRREGIELGRATSPAQVLALLEGQVHGRAEARAGSESRADHAPQARAPETGSFDAVLLDLNYERDTTSGEEGFSLLSRLRRDHPSLPIVVMTGWASIEGAVEAMRRGAADYVPKPWDNTRLVALLRGLLPAPDDRGSPERLSSGAGSAAMRQLHATLEQVAFSDVSILITGEHGSGKELVARSVHDKSGRRGEFVALNAGALADGTFESELFGHVRGAFTDAKAAREGAFARAEGGTLFLDEVANMPHAQQAKLLRVLQERTYQPLGASAPRVSTARIVSATNADIEALARSGAFRADLLYRLNAIRVHVPPLRERLEELEALVGHFIAREVARYGLPIPRCDAGVMGRLRAHAWPGNVRELEHVIQRAVLLSAREGQLACAHLDLEPTSGAMAPAGVPVATSHTATPDAASPPAVTPHTLRDAEKAAILQALARFPEDRRAAAESLGLSRSAFYRRLSQYGIRPSK